MHELWFLCHHQNAKYEVFEGTWTRGKLGHLPRAHLGSFCCEAELVSGPWSVVRLVRGPRSAAACLLALASLMTAISPASPARAGADADESDDPPETPQQVLSALCADIDFNDDRRASCCAPRHCRLSTPP